MQDSKKNPSQRPPSGKDAGAEDRRRLGRIVHDERGNAIVQWEEAPPGYQRPVLEIDRGSGHPDCLPDPHGFDPYANPRPRHRQGSPDSSPTDLRKLSEWIKLVREMDQKKQHGDDTDGD